MDDKEKLALLETEEENIRRRLNEIRNEVKQIELKKLSLDKFHQNFISYIEPGDSIRRYMFVETIMVDDLHYRNFDFHYIMRGYGFSGEFTEYHDATWFNWDYMDEIYIYGMMNDFEKKVSHIKIITKEEFDQKFNEYLDKTKELHAKKIEKLTK